MTFKLPRPIFFGFLLAFSCASAPSWRAHPQSSFTEAVSECGTFQPAAPLKRPIEIKPWVECFEQVPVEHPGPELPGYAVFTRELRNFYDLPESTWNPERVQAFFTAGQTMARKIWMPTEWYAANASGGGAAGPRALGEYFPLTVAALAVNANDGAAANLSAKPSGGARASSATSRAVPENRPVALDRVSARVTDWFRPAAAAGLRDAQTCQKAANLRKEVEQLIRVWEDLAALDQLRDLPAEKLQAAHAGFERRLQSVTEQTEQLQAQNPRFLHCG